jgi:hypothetical protein
MSVQAQITPIIAFNRSLYCGQKNLLKVSLVIDNAAEFWPQWTQGDTIEIGTVFCYNIHVYNEPLSLPSQIILYRNSHECTPSSYYVSVRDHIDSHAQTKIRIELINPNGKHMRTIELKDIFILPSIQITA